MGCGLSPSSVLAVLVVLQIGLAMAQDSLSYADTLPPSMMNIPRRNTYFWREEKIELACVAGGNPKPVYYWFKNGVKLDLTAAENKARMSMSSGVGSLVIIDAKDTDEGVYQCVAENTFGKSFSLKRNVQLGRMDPFPAMLEPETKRVPTGSSLILVCNPPFSIPPATISWIRQSDHDEYDYLYDDEGEFDLVNLDERITVDWDGNLYITNVKETDVRGGNRYVCMTNNKVARIIHQGSDVIVELNGNLRDVPASLMWNSNDDVLGLLGKTIRFKCIFAGNPQPIIIWKRIGGKRDNSRMTQSNDKFEFVIKNVQYDDAGVYECEGSNLVSQNPESRRFTLNVESEPMWRAEPKAITVGVRENAMFSCDAGGRPKPTVQWFINGSPIALEPPNPRRILSGNNLTFTNLLRSDSQVIQCNATNRHGFIWADFFLYVIALPAKVETKPMDKLKVAKGQKVTITCESSGKPKPDVTWFKGDQMLAGARHQIQDNGNLIIMNVTHSDSGNYTCYARNIFGKDSASGSLIVREKTRIDAAPFDIRLLYGNDATFTCGASTDYHETLEYIWLRDGERIDEHDPRVDMMDGTLTILNTNSEDTADYTCVASNGLDNDTVTAKLEVKAPPDPPYDVDIISCLSDMATVKWKFNEDQINFSPLRNFIVEYNTSFNPEEWIVGDRPSAESRKTNVRLSLWVKYHFRVKAVNGIAVGKPSEITTFVCQTPQGRPDRHPRKVSTVGDKTNWLVVEWEPMPQIEHNAEDFLYNITVKDTNEKLVMNFVEYDYTVGRKEILVYKVYQPYEVTVRAQNRVGQPLAKAKTIDGFSGEAVPTVVPGNFELDPEKIITATHVAFRWNPVDTSSEAMQGEFNGYKIRFWKVDQKATTMHEVLIPHSKRQIGRKVKAEVHHMLAYSHIQADVVAVNNYFSSNGSNIVNFSTPEGVPSPVAYLEVLYRGSTHFLLEWGEPKEPNGNVTGYRVSYRTILDHDYGGLVVGDIINEKQTILEGLTPDQEYRVYVRALTKKAMGEDYFIDVRTAKFTDELAKPTIVQAVTTGSFVNVSWQLPDARGTRVGDRFVVEYRKTGDSQWTRGIGDKKGYLWQQIEGLEQTTAYEVRVLYEAGQPGTVDFMDTSSNIAEFETTIIELVKPTIVDVKASKLSINITWNLLETQGKQVGDSCFVEYRETSDTEWKRVAVEGNEVLHHQFDGLKQATAYKVRVVYESGQPGTSNFRKSSSNIMGTKTKTADPDEADCPEDDLKETVCSLKDMVMKLEQELGMLKKAIKGERRERRRLNNFVHQVVVRQYQ